MAKLDLSAEGIGMIYLHCNELQKEYVLAVEAQGMDYEEQVKKVNDIIKKLNKYNNSFFWFYTKIVDENPEEYMKFYDSSFRKNIDTLYREYNEKYEMYREYINRTKVEKNDSIK